MYREPAEDVEAKLVDAEVEAFRAKLRAGERRARMQVVAFAVLIVAAFVAIVTVTVAWVGANRSTANMAPDCHVVYRIDVDSTPPTREAVVVCGDASVAR